MNAIKYVILLPPVNRYLISLLSSTLCSAVYSGLGSVVKKTVIYTARTAYSAIVR
jgi:hypothetical protein